MSKLTTKDNKKKVSIQCNYNCFECELPDCFNDILTLKEVQESNLRDAIYTNYGNIVVTQRPARSKHRHRYINT